MIIQKCDLCNKEVEKVNTMVLYNKSFDYCKDCEEKAEIIRKVFDEKRNHCLEVVKLELELAEKKIFHEYIV